jgi:hypothetical protein
LTALGCGWVPLAAGAFVLTGLVVPYIMAVKSGHVLPFLPYVSDTGTLQLESCVFGQMLNAASALMALMVYLRHSQVAIRTKDVHGILLTFINNVSALSGLLAAIGLGIVGNFQQPMDGSGLQMNLHNLGASMCFGSGVFYGFFQGYITRALSTDFWSWLMAIVRFGLSALTTVFFITYVVYIGKAFAQFTGSFPDHMHWRPEDGGYKDHIISAAAEYLTALTFALFIVTFYYELRTVKQVRDMWYPKQE